MGLTVWSDIKNLFGRFFRKQKKVSQTSTFDQAAVATVNVLDLMDLSNQNVQYFSIPYPLIKYIFDNSSIISSQKLIKCCKYFKILHLKRNKSEIDVLESCQNVCYVAAGLSKKRAEVFPLTTQKLKLISVMKSIKVLNSFVFLESHHSDSFFSIIEKLDLSQTKRINIMVSFAFEQSILEKIVQSSLENLAIWCHSSKNVYPALLAFQRCPKLKNIWMHLENLNSPIPLINKDIFKKMIATKREIKIVNVTLEPVIQIDQTDFISFLENHMASNSIIVLKTEVEEAFNKLNQMFDTIQTNSKKNENNGIKIALYWRRIRIVYYV